MPLTKRALALSKKLGIAPDQVREKVEGNADLAADIVRQRLQAIIDQIKGSSPSGALNDYEAIIIKGKQESIRLPKSGVTITGNWNYIVTVQASPGHKAQGLNVFNILDAGNPDGIPKSDTPIPLWNAALDGSSTRRVLEKAAGGRYAVAKTVKRSAIRPEPGRGRYDGEDKIQFTRGPIKSLPAMRLYERAEAAAKDALAGQGFTQWEVIYVGPTAED